MLLIHLISLQILVAPLLLVQEMPYLLLLFSALQLDNQSFLLLRTVEERSQTSNSVQKPTIFYAGRLAIVIERENTVETAKAFIRKNKDAFTGNVLFFNWLDQ